MMCCKADFFVKCYKSNGRMQVTWIVSVDTIVNSFFFLQIIAIQKKYKAVDKGGKIEA